VDWIIYEHEQCLGGWLDGVYGWIRNGLGFVDGRTVYNLALGVDWS
jgi:hypothetical protein